MKRTDYVVFRYGWCGEKLEAQRFETFEDALAEYRNRTVPRALHNEDNYDVDNSDGLTENQRDIVWGTLPCITDGCNHSDCEEAARRRNADDRARDLEEDRRVDAAIDDWRGA